MRKHIYNIGMNEENDEKTFMALMDCICSYGGEILGLQTIAGVDVIRFKLKSRKFRRLINLIRKETPRQIFKVKDVWLIS